MKSAKPYCSKCSRTLEYDEIDFTPQLEDTPMGTASTYYANLKKTCKTCREEITYEY